MSYSLRSLWLLWFSSCLLLGLGCQGDHNQQQSNDTQSESNDKDQESNDTQNQDETTMSTEKATYGKLVDGREVDLYTCTNANGATSYYDSKTLYTHILVHFIKPGRY